MQSPSPSPSSAPSPPQSASLLQHHLANGFQDHVMVSGTLAMPSIWTTSVAIRDNLGREAGHDNVINTTGLSRDHVSSTSNAVSRAFNTEEQVAGLSPSFTSISGQVYGTGVESNQLSNYTSNHGQTQGMQFSGINYTSRNAPYTQAITEFDNKNGHIPSEVSLQQRLTAFHVHQEQFPYSAKPYYGDIVPSIRPTYPGDWDQSMTTFSESFQDQHVQQYNSWNPTQTIQSQAMATQSFHNQQPGQQQNSWDPTQTVQSQSMANSAPIPLLMQITYRTPCSWQSCTESFTRASDLQRHIESVHLGIRYHCFWIGCANNGGKGYCRAEKLRTHQRQKHGFA